MKIHDLSRARIYQIVKKMRPKLAEQRRINATKWPRAGLATPIELEGPRDQWLVSTLEGFDINVRPDELGGRL